MDVYLTYYKGDSVYGRTHKVVEMVEGGFDDYQIRVRPYNRSLINYRGHNVYVFFYREGEEHEVDYRYVARIEGLGIEYDSVEVHVGDFEPSDSLDRSQQENYDTVDGGGI